MEKRPVGRPKQEKDALEAEKYILRKFLKNPKRWPCETVKASREAYKRFQNENVWNWVEYYFDEQQKKQLYSALQTKKT
ncbi:MAG: hypothetical protein Q9M28_00040, partial [Mariprofundaceae bacterium]|nr:hypothetical protein [Mariprofundaceae bacterium]